MRAFTAIAELNATARHIELLNSKIDRLAQARADSWDQALSTVARMYRAGEIDMTVLIDLYAEMRVSFGPGFTRQWNKSIPVGSEGIKAEILRRDYAKRAGHLNAPNGPNGTWQGGVPDRGSPAPPRGQSVVYVLFDASNTPIYVGSTYTFRARLNTHLKDKPVASWTAFPCRNREHAYELEDLLLKQYKPTLNRKASR
jgi:hypothetical protein